MLKRFVCRHRRFLPLLLFLDLFWDGFFGSPPAATSTFPIHIFECSLFVACMPYIFLDLLCFCVELKIISLISLNISLLELLHTLGFIVQEVLSRDNTLDHPLVWVVFFNPRWYKVLVFPLILSIQRDCLGERFVFSHYGKTPLQVLELIQFAGSQLREACLDHGLFSFHLSTPAALHY